MIVKQISPSSTYKLRLDILKTNDNYEHKYKGDFDDKTIHLGAFNGEENIGIITLIENKNPLFEGIQIQLRGMAVVNGLQNKGVGRELVKIATEISMRKKATILWCNAREHVVDFYKKQGFNIEGERFYIQHVCYHYLMYKKL